jgi:hypothetical protein
MIFKETRRHSSGAPDGTKTNYDAACAGVLQLYRAEGIVLIWLSYLAVPPFLDIALRQQSATSDENLDTLGDSIVSIITFRQVTAHFVRSSENHKCNFPPRCFSNGENDFINLEVAQRTHCQRLQNALTLWSSVPSENAFSRSRLGHYRAVCGGLLLAIDSWEHVRDAEEREQCDDADHEDGNHFFSFSDTSNMHELFQSGGPSILLTGKHPSSVLSRKATKT